MPLGLTYSLIPLAAGAGVMVGGCMLDAAADGKGALCQLSVIGGMALMRTAPVGRALFDRTCGIGSTYRQRS